jgi:hypothetical protein
VTIGPEATVVEAVQLVEAIRRVEAVVDVRDRLSYPPEGSAGKMEASAFNLFMPKG